MSKYLEFAVGWLKETTKGQYISAQTSKGNPATGKPAVKLIAEFDDGRQVTLTNFAVFFNENKKSEKTPDVQFVYNTENDQT
jgi:hypothetical protein